MAPTRHMIEAPPGLETYSGSAWRVQYARRLAATDLVVLLVAAVTSVFVRFGAQGANVRPDGFASVTYVEVAAGIATAWWLSLSLARSRDHKVIGTGAEEFRRVVRASVLTFGCLTMAAVLFKWDFSRGVLAATFPLGTMGLVLGRSFWRTRLRRQRAAGRMLSRVLVIGSRQSAARLVTKANLSAREGLIVQGVWVPDGARTWLLGDGNEFHPVVDAQYSPLEAVVAARADTVIVTDTEHLGPETMRDLTWQLARIDVEFMVSPNLIDIAAARMHVGSVGGEPLLLLDKPQYTQAGNAPKGFFDASVGVCLATLSAPLLLSAALAVQVSKPGPVLVKEERIGRNGHPFSLLMLRTPDAADGGAYTRFVTWFIRRFAIDSLPKLINVVRGDMSLVGPPAPVAPGFGSFDAQSRRRLTVRPGITGPSQLAGVPDDQRSLQLDLSYIANWSMTADLLLVFETMRRIVLPPAATKSVRPESGRPPRLAIIGTRGYPSYYGGFETAVRRLAPHMAECGWDVTVYGRAVNIRADDPDNDPRVKSVITRGIDNKSFSTLSYGLTSSIHALIHKPDVALVMNVANGFWLPLLGARGIPTLVNVDGIEWERDKWGRAAKTVFRMGARMTAKFGDELVYDARLIEDYWKGVFGRDGWFIPYGGEPMDPLPVEPGLESGKYVLLVARFVPENTIEEFFDAAEILAAEGVPVVLVGSTGTVGALDDRARELHDKFETIDWRGHVSDDRQLFSLWQHAGVYFHGHSVGGTNPALVQAMALGAPTVARDTRYNREVLGHGGIFVAPNPEAIADAIRGVLADRDAGLAQADIARTRSEQFYTWEGVCSAYQEVLTEMAGYASTDGRWSSIGRKAQQHAT